MAAASHSGLFVVDSAKFLRFELKDPKAEEFSEAIGFVVYSNSKVSVKSSKSLFELIWNEHLQYGKLQESGVVKVMGLQTDIEYRSDSKLMNELALVRADSFDHIAPIYFPKGSSEFNAVEECWRQGNMICWYQNTIRNLKISDMLLQTTIEQDVSN